MLAIRHGMLCHVKFTFRDLSCLVKIRNKDLQYQILSVYGKLAPSISRCFLILEIPQFLTASIMAVMFTVQRLAASELQVPPEEPLAYLLLIDHRSID